MWPFKKKPIERMWTAKLPSTTSSAKLDTYSDTWKAVQRHCEKRIAEFRLRNDSPNNDLIKTCMLRGQIKFCKEILGLPDAKDQTDE